MNNEDVEEYINVLFSKSTKGERATACTIDWLDFLQEYNVQQGYYVLTEDELQEMEAYCAANPDLEMTPDEFVRLIYTVRDLPDDSIGSYYPVQDNTTGYFQDRESTNHPGPQIQTSPRLVSSNLKPKVAVPKESQLLRQLRQENEQLLRKYEKQLDNLNSLSERIGLLESRLEAAKLESSQQKAVIDSCKNKEKERQETIAHLRLLVNDYETNHDQDQIKLNQKDDELQELQQQLHEIQTSHQSTLSCLEVAERDLYQIKEHMRQQEKQKLEQADQSRQYDSEIQHLQQENSRLLGVIDKQKFDLDEARASRYVMDKRDNTTQEQLQLDYEEKLNRTIDQHQQIIETLENELNEAQRQNQLDQQIQHELRQKIATLSTQFDHQHELIQVIQKKLSLSAIPSPTHQFFYLLSILPWVFFLYHLLIYLIETVYGLSRRDSIHTSFNIASFLLGRLDELLRGL
ncbi:hypothetical protein A0J61_03400 [Choanephora cucurbitarum]|uniref:Uncharacterized protein n=1 Tax=Choanephora cucurbitarum TaxID=101091 RepID=A0A1C7NMQ6_9FUNG|nr:hypothetical protein A0J61_03400 [Choanephora cucurbitarum]